MKNNLSTNLIIIVLIMSTISCNKKSGMQEKIDQTIQAATQADIPLIQFKYHSDRAKTNVFFEHAISDSVKRATGNNNTIFPAASLSKAVFSYVVLRMYDRGEIDIDQPIYTYYTDLDRFVNKEYAMRITPRMVLAHTTGLISWSTGPSTESWPVTPIESLYEPGTAFGYSGEGFAYLQRAIEFLKGKTLQQIAQDEVFIPFGMPMTNYGWKSEYDQIAVEGHNRSGVNVGQSRHPRENSAYTLRTNTKEYSRFIEKALVKGEGLKKETHKMMFEPQVHAIRYNGHERSCDKYIDWGLSIGIEHNEELGDIYWHWGDNGSFKALFVIVPSQKSYILYFTNSAHGHEIIDQITSIWLGTQKPLSLNCWIHEEIER